ncbi:MAG TPA: hypothetical protein VII12_00035 [Thermoanaerobaculia bacterium]|jgi:hypothetical protein
MSIRTNTALLTCLLLAAPSLFADDDKGKKGKHHDDERGKIERHDRDDDEHENEVRRAALPAKRVVRINNDVNRLESILATAQNSAIAFPQPTLTRVANEANMLANRIFANAKHLKRSDALATARDLRMHTREMHKSAVRGDAAGVRLHAGQALSFAVRLDNIV